MSLTADEETRVRALAAQLPEGVGLVELALIERLTTFERNMQGLLQRLFADDEAAFSRMLALLEGTDGDQEASLDMGIALDQTIRERDAARAAAARLEADGRHYLARMIRGLA